MTDSHPVLLLRLDMSALMRSSGGEKRGHAGAFQSGVVALAPACALHGHGEG